MKKASKFLLAIGAASGVAAYIINRIGSSKKDEPSFEDTLELFQSDIEGMNFNEFDEFISKLAEHEIPSNLTNSERSEYLKAVSVLSDDVQKASIRFMESGELSDEEADALRQMFRALGSYAKHSTHLMD